MAVKNECCKVFEESREGIDDDEYILTILQPVFVCVVPMNNNQKNIKALMLTNLRWGYTIMVEYNRQF